MELKTLFATDNHGNVTPGALAYLYQAGTTTPVAGLLDVNGDPLANPFTAGADGLLQFRAAPGEYDLRITYKQLDRKIRVQFLDAADVDADAFGSADAAAGFARQRANHTGTQDVSTVNGLPDRLAALEQFDVDIANATDPAKGAGIIPSVVRTVATVAEMVSMNGWSVGQKVRTLGYYSAGDGGENEYVIVPAGTGSVDGGSYIDVPGAQAKAVFGRGIVYTKQFGTIGDSSSTGQQSKIQKSLDYVRTDSTSGAPGADVALSQGAHLISSRVDISGDRTLRGTGGQNSTKIIASSDYSGDTMLIRASGAFSKVENLGVRTDTSLYDPSTNTGIQTKCIRADSSGVFGNVYRDVRVNGGHVGFDIAAGLETKIHNCFVLNAFYGADIAAWDTEINNTIIQDVQVGVRTSNGLEANNLHIVRAAQQGLDIYNNGTPVNINGLFIDTPKSQGVRLRDTRGAQFSNTYVLKIGDNANGAAVGFKFETNSSQNNIIGGNAINNGTNFLSVFQFETSCVNNLIVGFKTTNKTINSGSEQRMRSQTVLGCHGDAARFNNVPRQNRAIASSVSASGTTVLSFQLDYEYPTITFNTLLFSGRWVSRNTNSDSAYGTIYIPVMFNDNGCSPVISKLSGNATVEWSVVSASLSGSVLSVTLKNDGTQTSSISVELARSIDATGMTF